MKKLACLFTVFCLTVLVTACGGSADEGGTKQSESAVSAETTPSPGVSAETTSAPEVSVETESADTESESAETASAPGISAETENADTESENTETETENAETDTEKSAADQEQKGRLLYMGHASLRITTPEGKVIYIDPYAGEGYEPAADLILVTHGHYDHSDMDKIANRNPDCRTITWQEALADGTYQTFDLNFAAVEAVEAGNNQYHSTEECVGYIVVLSDGTSVYVTGDTSTTQQMSSLAEKEIDYAFFCCDGVYNMDLEEAAQCAELVGAKHNIPYHMTAADSEALFDRSRAEQFNVPNLLILEDGQEIELE